MSVFKHSAVSFGTPDMPPPDVGSNKGPISLHNALWGTAVQITVDFALPILGGLIASRRPNNPIGWMVCAAALANAADYFTDGYALYALLAEPDSLPGGGVAARGLSWLSTC